MIKIILNCVQKNFPEKNHSALPKQLTNIIIKFYTLKLFEPVKIKLKVINKCRAYQQIYQSLSIELVNKYCNHKITQPCQNNLQTFS